ncbi:hypothetical protein I2486_18725 [Cellulophaga sp. E16_2]|uniref:Uncharacterized protein n=1 Tax=Cellulophaga algicola (strain DSM 14237 / IC166 / ACAM 630) TaxID=688270 RepID=E6XBD2_CELAD|nr:MULTISPECIES: hypothetical protein [Cellulophaga]ADV51045.1 hypothetical protein Celal_3796 [Cellulophaga algicola DSM 14237]MBO0593437.1 hypothetical protein [Cellulophaga sp. E16_2]
MSKKGKEKNTKNKAKHTKLMNRKINKQRDEKEVRKQRLKEIQQQGKKPKE